MKRFVIFASLHKNIFRLETTGNTPSEPHVEKPRQPQTSWDLSTLKKSVSILKGVSNTSWRVKKRLFLLAQGVKELQRDRNQSWLTLPAVAAAHSVENLLSGFSTGVSVSPGSSDTSSLASDGKLAAGFRWRNHTVCSAASSFIPTETCWHNSVWRCSSWTLPGSHLCVFGGLPVA